MRLRNIPAAEGIISGSPYVIQEPKDYKGKWHTVFGNEKPLQIEIGMGKGKFILKMAKAYPEINFVGIERYTSVLLRAVQKMEQEALPPSNLKFICMDAGEIEEVYAPGEVNKIFLNFSDPWPKDRHARRRLPSRQFLERFSHILADTGKLEFKTDNRALFDFALEELEPAGWIAEKVTFDLHHDEEMGKDNIMTEYEEKFSAKGNPICKYIISKKN
ncbi:MAG: tRNA (guanosine(46)-N7)-methyltransferase TrmB [Lachnospiraceae bacterium]|nr:tRNA (guanosine(46)-N7)-methyltransferase TrmB [Lachnospiraceae bacterium]